MTHFLPEAGSIIRLADRAFLTCQQVQQGVAFALSYHDERIRITHAVPAQAALPGAVPLGFVYWYSLHFIPLQVWQDRHVSPRAYIATLQFP
jgi:hypothetical protein